MSENKTFRAHLALIMDTFGEPVIDLHSVAAFLGVSSDTLMRDKNFPKHKIGGRWKVTAINLAQYLSR